MRHVFLPLAMVAGVVALLTGCQTVSPPGAEGIDPVAKVDVVLDLPGASYELAIDSATHTIWLASILTGEKDTLWAVDTDTEVTRAIDLPDVEYNGYTTHVRIGQDGVVWVSLPYELVRWDPIVDNVTSIRFAEEVDGSLPDALDPGVTLPGTWLSGILPDGTGVLVSRNHVPYLTRVDADLSISRGPEVAVDYAGAADLARLGDGSILLLPALDNPSAAVTILGGPEIPGTTDAGPHRFLVDGTAVSALSLDDSAVVVASTTDQPGARELWTRTNGAGTSVQYDVGAGTLTWTSFDGSREVLQLEQFQGQTSGGGIDPATGEKLSENTSVATWDRLTDFVVSDDGAVWMLRHDGTQLVRWDP